MDKTSEIEQLVDELIRASYNLAVAHEWGSGGQAAETCCEQARAALVDGVRRAICGDLVVSTHGLAKSQSEGVTCSTKSN